MIRPVREIAHIMVVTLSGLFASSAQADEAKPLVPAQMVFTGISGGKSDFLREIFGDDQPPIPATASFGLMSADNKKTGWESEECTRLLEDEGEETIKRLHQQFDRAALGKERNFFVPKWDLNPKDIDPRSVLPSIRKAVADGVKACGLNY